MLRMDKLGVVPVDGTAFLSKIIERILHDA
jgi:hypothetical protein